jgi:hypothetical protein
MADQNLPPLLPFVPDPEQVEQRLYRASSHCLEELALLLQQSRTRPRSLNGSLDQVAEPLGNSLYPSPEIPPFSDDDMPIVRLVALHRLCCHDDFLFPTVEETLRSLESPEALCIEQSGVLPSSPSEIVPTSTVLRMVGANASGLSQPKAMRVGASAGVGLGTTDTFLTLRLERSNATIVLLHLCEGTQHRNPYGLNSQDALSSEPVHLTHSSEDPTLRGTGRRTAMTQRCNHKMGVAFIPRWVKLQQSVLQCLSAVHCNHAQVRFHDWRETSQRWKAEREQLHRADQLRPYFLEWRSLALDPYVRESNRKRDAFIAGSIRAMNRRRLVRRTLLAEYLQHWRINLVEERMEGLADAFLYRMSLFNAFSKWHERYTDLLSTRMIRRQRLERCYSIWKRAWHARLEEQALKRTAFKVWNERWKMERLRRRRLLSLSLRKWKTQLRLTLRSSVALTPPLSWSRSKVLRGALLLVSTKEDHLSRGAPTPSPLIEELSEVIERMIVKHGVDTRGLLSALVPCQDERRDGLVWSIPTAASLKGVWRLWRDRTLCRQFQRGRLVPLFSLWRRRADEKAKKKRIAVTRNAHLLEGAFHWWRERLAKCKRENFLVLLFQNDSVIRLKKSCLAQWGRRFQKLGSRRSQRVRALEARNRRLLATAWNTWCAARIHIRHVEAADQLHTMQLRKSSWEHWKHRWLTLQGLQDARLKCADELFHCSLKHRVLRLWFSQLQAARKKQAALCDRRRRMKAAFWIWLRRYRIRVLAHTMQEQEGAPRSPHRPRTGSGELPLNFSSLPMAMDPLPTGPSGSRALILRGRLLALHSTTQTRRFFDPLIMKGLRALTVLDDSSEKLLRAPGLIRVETDSRHPTYTRKDSDWIPETSRTESLDDERVGASNEDGAETTDEDDQRMDSLMDPEREGHSFRVLECDDEEEDCYMDYDVPGIDHDFALAEDQGQDQEGEWDEELEEEDEEVLNMDDSVDASHSTSEGDSLVIVEV